jgi:hypothetical protein
MALLRIVATDDAKLSLHHEVEANRLASDISDIRNDAGARGAGLLPAGLFAD